MEVNNTISQDTMVYDKNKVTQNTIRYNKETFRPYIPIEDEYVLKVDNITDNSISKEISKHKLGHVNKNPNNLPAIRKNVSMKKVKKIIALTVLFISAFSISAFIGYNVTFLLFTLK